MPCQLLLPYQFLVSYTLPGPKSSNDVSRYDCKVQHDFELVSTSNIWTPASNIEKQAFQASTARTCLEALLFNVASRCQYVASADSALLPSTDQATTARLARRRHLVWPSPTARPAQRSRCPALRARSPRTSPTTSPTASLARDITAPMASADSEQALSSPCASLDRVSCWFDCLLIWRQGSPAFYARPAATAPSPPPPQWCPPLQLEIALPCCHSSI